jgi:hypothetical protein
LIDLSKVVEQAAAGDDNLQFAVGDMFESIPPANAVFLKVSISLRSHSSMKLTHRFRNAHNLLWSLKYDKQ